MDPSDKQGEAKVWESWVVPVPGSIPGDEAPPVQIHYFSDRFQEYGAPGSHAVKAYDGRYLFSSECWPCRVSRGRRQRKKKGEMY